MHNLADTPEISHCGKVLSFPQFPGSAPAPAPPGTRTAAEEEPASSRCLVPFVSLEKKWNFFSRNELRSSSSSAGKNGKAPRSVFLAKRYRLAWKLRRRFRPLASDYTILCLPTGQKVKLSLPLSLFGRNWSPIFYIIKHKYSCQENRYYFHTSPPPSSGTLKKDGPSSFPETFFFPPSQRNYCNIPQFCIK